MPHGSTEINIARWNILVNNMSIKDNPDISNTLTPVFPGNENIAEGIIAPTAEGYFDLNFDVSAADVSFKYEITTSVHPNSSVKDLIVTGYSIDGGEKINVDDPNLPIADTILLTDNVDTRNFRIFVKWNDGANSTMNNKDDTIATISGLNALLTIKVSFTQVV